MNDCQERPNQNIKIISPPNDTSSLDVKSVGIVLLKWFEYPNNVFVQLLK